MKLVLLSAYSISPESNSEPGMAWRQFLELLKLKKYSFVLLTRKKNVKIIEEYLNENNIQDVVIEGVDLPKTMLFWKKGHIAMHLYYYVWQLLAFFRAKRLVKSQKIVLAHHISFMTIRTSFVSFLGIPSILGPVGGAQLPPVGFKKVLGGGKNTLRTLSILSMQFSPLWRKFIHSTNVIILANNENKHIIPHKDITHCHVLQIPWWTEQNKKYVNVPNIPTPVDSVDAVRLLWCSRLMKWKGLEVALRSLSQLVKKHKFNQVRLDVVGRGEDQQYFQELTNSLGLSNYVFFRGFVTDEEKKQLFLAADICIFTSLHETTGTTLFEYLDYSKCTVVLDHAGPGEIGRNTECEMIDCSKGLKHAVDMLSFSLYKLSTDEESRNSRGLLSNRLFLNKYSPDNYIQEIDKFYRAILND
jgi:glycosyltransferase involved in cell wall biosynthesis